MNHEDRGGEEREKRRSLEQDLRSEGLPFQFLPILARPG